MQLPLRPDVRRVAKIHFLIQRPRFDAYPLRRLWIVMVDANTTSCAKGTATDSSRVSFALEMTDMLFG